jgi:hypothetical protein
LVVSFRTSPYYLFLGFPAGVLPLTLPSRIRFGILLTNILTMWPVHLNLLTLRSKSLYSLYSSSSCRILQTPLNFLSLFLYLTSCLPTHCRCAGLLLYLITLNDTHTHSVGLLWPRDRTVTKTST